MLIERFQQLWFDSLGSQGESLGDFLQLLSDSLGSQGESLGDFQPLLFGCLAAPVGLFGCRRWL